MTTLLVFVASFSEVFLRAAQQKNVIQNRYLWVVPISYGMAFTKFYVIIWVVLVEGLGWWAIFLVGTASWLGAWSAMWAHDAFSKRFPNGS